ncbi:MAG: MarR family transcriptional regulator [Anaerolineales bacterium]|nr:MAG: MarR family transcriptional regulator [Anaerolineales bacterium]
MTMPEFQDSLGRTLAHICRLHHARADALLESLGLYRGQPPVLFALWHQDGLTHSELAHHLNVKPATITRMIQRMEKTGFVEKRPDADDQRVSRVFLTAAGYEIRHKVNQIFAQMESEIFGAFTPQEHATLSGFLHRISRNLELTKENSNIHKPHF